MKSMVKLTAAIALATAASASTQAAEFSANVTLATDYKFRGWSQTDTSPAIQGGFDVNFDNGFYIGTWGSNVDFAKSLELDYYAGYAGDISEDVSFDVGYLYYDYPGTPDTTTGLNGKISDDYQEIYGSVSYKDLTIGLHISDDYYLESGEFTYLYVDYGFELPNGFNLGLHYALNSFDNASNDSNLKDAEVAFLGDGADDYIDYSISLTKELAGVELGLSWVDTDLDTAECGGSSTACDGSFIFSISKSL